MKANEAHAIAKQAKEHLLSEVGTYAAKMVEEIKSRVKDQVNRGEFRCHFRSSPDNGDPYNIRGETLPLVLKQLENEGYKIEFSQPKASTPPFGGSFTISW